MHCRTVIFHHLNIFCTSGHVLWLGGVVSPLSLPSYCDLQCTKRGMCRRVRKLYVNSYTSFVNPLRTDIHTYIHTYKHKLRLRPHKRLPHLHNYVSHAKAFGNDLFLIELNISNSFLVLIHIAIFIVLWVDWAQI